MFGARGPKCGPGCSFLGSRSPRGAGLQRDILRQGKPDTELTSGRPLGQSHWQGGGEGKGGLRLQLPSRPAVAPLQNCPQAPPGFCRESAGEHRSASGNLWFNPKSDKILHPSASLRALDVVPPVPRGHLEPPSHCRLQPSASQAPPCSDPWAQHPAGAGEGASLHQDSWMDTKALPLALVSRGLVTCTVTSRPHEGTE